MPSFRGFLVAVNVCLAIAGLSEGLEPVRDVPFVQEYRDAFISIGEGADADDITAIALNGHNVVFTVSMKGIHHLDDNGAWSPLLTGDNAGPAFCAETDAAGTVWFGAWNGLYRTNADGTLKKVQGIDRPISAMAFTPSGCVAMGPHGMWRETETGWTHAKGNWADSPRDIACENDGTLWVATGHGLFHISGTDVLERLHKEEDIRSGETRAVAFAPDGRLWVGGDNGLDVFEDGERVTSYTPAEGLAHHDVRSLAFAPDGILWIGTAAGVQRFDGTSWSLRHSLRWLPSDDVREVAFEQDGTAWIATGAGLSVIRKKMITLEEKARHFHEIVMARKIREPWLVEKSRLLTPGDISTWRSEDDDNDGSYTMQYMVMEIFRHKVTGDPKARENALKAFEAMEFLQTVTGTDGFVARTVVPMWWTSEKNDNPHRLHDRNRTYTPQEIASENVMDPRYKPVEVRWRPSADGKWLWKGDTSSDEIVGHFWGWLFFHDLLAETPEEKQRVRDLTKRVMDHIIAGGLTLVDTDGTHTRWGVWAPEMLNGDADWAAERPVNATEILSFLRVTEHITGDGKYGDIAKELIQKHGYGEFARAPKPTAPSERTHIDSDLLSLTFPGLLMTNPEASQREIYTAGLRQWHGQIANEYSPMYSFVAGSLVLEEFGLEQCVEFLRDAPLDNIRWTVDNTVREDLKLVREPELSPLQTDRLPPASERGIMRWDKNPWAAVSGDGGNTEGSTIYWLLPYWMGRYHGFIGAPEQG